MGRNGPQRNGTSDWALGADKTLSRVPRDRDAVAGALLQGGGRGAERAWGGMPWCCSPGPDGMQPGWGPSRVFIFSKQALLGGSPCRQDVKIINGPDEIETLQIYSDLTLTTVRKSCLVLHHW